MKSAGLLQKGFAGLLRAANGAGVGFCAHRSASGAFRKRCGKFGPTQQDPVFQAGRRGWQTETGVRVDAAEFAPRRRGETVGVLY